MRGLWFLTLAMVGCADVAAPPVFTVRPIALSVVTQSLVAQDLDDDGRLDLVSVGGGGAAVRPLIAGRFAEVTSYALPDNPLGLALGDLDGDGRLDLATALPLRGTLAWLPGAATGLGSVRELVIDAALRTLVAGDVDGDGFADVVAAAQDSDALLLLRGGVQGPTLTQRLQLGEVNALALADLDGDGRAEVLASRPDIGAVQRLTLDAAGLLAPGANVWQTPFPIALATADLDEDGALDLAAVDSLARRVFVGLGDGAGSWRSRNQWAVDVEPTALLVRRGAQGPELLLAGADRRSLVMIDPNSGAARIRSATAWNHAGLAVGDLDGDGIEEIVHDDAVLRDTAGFGLRTHGPSVGLATRSLLRVDLDGDGNEELIAEEPERAELVVYATDGAALLERSRVPAPPELAGLRALASGDGRHDVAWWSATGFGTLTGPDLDTMSFVGQASIIDLVPLSLDADGAQEVAVVLETLDLGDGQDPIRFSGSVLLTIRVGDHLVPLVDTFAGGRISSVVAARLDDDPPDDLWIAHDAGVTVLRSGDAWPSSDAGSVTDLAGAHAADLDADGALDLIGCDPLGPRGVLAAYGRGDGTLGPVVQLAETPCTQVHSCDVDGDTRLDLVLEHSSDLRGPFAYANFASLEVLRATDDGWSSGGSLYPGLEAEALALRCAPDGLSLWTGGGRGLAFLDLIAAPALVEQRVAPVVSSALLGDLDGDGLDDLVVDDDPRVMLARADGVGGFAVAVSRSRPSSPAPGRIVGLGEFDGEPGVELLVAEVDLDGRRSHGLWALRDDRLIRTMALDVAAWEVLGDFDGDGRDELFMRDDGWPTLVRPGAEPLLLDREDFAGWKALRAADMDGDGLVDLLASATLPLLLSPSEIHVLQSEGSGFAAARTLGLEAVLGALAVGDLDDDGALDLVRVDREVGFMMCRAGDAGPASRCEATAWLAAPGVSRPVIEDLDDDGHSDLVLSWSVSEVPYLQLLRGDGAGGLEPAPAQVLVNGALRRARLGGERPGWVLVSAGQTYQLFTGATP